MNWEQLLRHFIFGGSAFGAGVAFGLFITRIYRFFSRGHHRMDLSAALFDLGCAGVVYLILLRIILPIRSLPITWDSVLYFIFLALMGMGGLIYLIDLWFSKSENRKEGLP